MSLFPGYPEGLTITIQFLIEGHKLMLDDLISKPIKYVLVFLIDCPIPQYCRDYWCDPEPPSVCTYCHNQTAYHHAYHLDTGACYRKQQLPETIAVSCCILLNVVSSLQLAWTLVLAGSLRRNQQLLG